MLVVDEAGGVPTRLMEQALRLAEQAGTRVVLMGDTGQTKAIEAGRLFAQLQVAGMSTARMEEIERQKAAVLKAAVELAAHGDARGSLAKGLACVHGTLRVQTREPGRARGSSRHHPF